VYEPKHIISRHWRLILFAAIAIGVAWIAYALRGVIFPFLLGLLLAYILLPAVDWIQARLPQNKFWRKINRLLAIIIIYALIIVFSGLFFLYVFFVIYNTLSSLVANADSIIASASAIIREWTGAFFSHVPPSLREEAGKYLGEVTTELANIARNFVTQTILFIPASVGFIAGLITMPVFMFLVLLDWQTIQSSFYARMSPGTAEYARSTITIAGDTMRRYFRGQFIMSIIIGLVDFIGMLVLGVAYAPALGAIAAVGEYIPWAGPVTAGAVAVLVALATSPEKTVYVVIWYFFVQFAENNLLVPKIQGDIMHIHPAAVLVVLVAGAQFAGFWGLLFALPVAAIAVRVYGYLRRVSAIQDVRDVAKGWRDDEGR
jgi:predicted PurR-regulated permease PerM